MGRHRAASAFTRLWQTARVAESAEKSKRRRPASDSARHDCEASLAKAKMASGCLGDLRIFATTTLGRSGHQQNHSRRRTAVVLWKHQLLSYMKTAGNHLRLVCLLIH